MLALLLLLLAALAAQHAEAIFADQAGLNDWTIQNVGEAIAALEADSRLFVSTNQGVVAALGTKSKDIEWRRVMLDSTVHRTLLYRKQVLISASRNKIMAWRAGDGILLWDFETEPGVEIEQVMFASDDVVVVLTSDKQILGLNKNNGVGISKLSTKLPAGVKQAGMYLTTTGFSTVESNAETNKITCGPHSFDSVDGQFALTTSGWLAFKQKKEDGGAVFVSLHNLRNSNDAKPVALPQLEGGVERVYIQNDAIVIELDANKRFVLAGDGEVRPIALEQGEFSQTSDGAIWSFAQQHGAATLTAKQDKKTFTSHTALKRGWQVDKSLLLGVGVDNSLSLFKLSSNQLEVVWTREECLAEVEQIVSVRIPLHHKLAPTNDNGLLGEILSQVNFAARTFVTNAMEMGTNLFESSMKFIQSGGQGAGHFDKLKQTKLVVSDDHELGRFGFNRVLVFLTKVGKLVAVHSETKQILWTFTLDDKQQREAQMFIHGEQVTLVVAAPAGNTVYMLNALTGEVLTTQELKLNQPILQIAQLDHSLVVLGKQGAVEELKQDGVSTEQAAAVYIPHWSNQDKSLTGYAVNQAAVATEAWRMVFSPKAELLALAAAPRNEVVSSPVRALGDGSLLVKFVDPHMVGLVVGGEEKDTVKMLLVDVVSGRVLHRALHRDASGPVHAVRFEHWIVYTYWNLRAARTELVSVSVYEKQVIGRKQVNPWTAVPLQRNFSSFDAADITVYSKNYVLPGQSITQLGVTRTLRGIAAKNLLVSLGGTGQILMLDQRLIDPRRTLAAPTEEEKLEGLFQYSPELPIVPQHIISYYQGAGERGATLFHVAPAQLESTCTVVASGLDVFKGRASPSGAFDLLAEDFDYILLVTFIVFLAIGVIVLRTMERKKSLQAAWV